MVEIIPKLPQSSPFFLKLLYIISLGVFSLAVGGFLLLLFLGIQTENKIKTAETLLAAEKTEAQIVLEQDVFTAQVRLQDFAKLIPLRKSALPIFSFLETIVHPDVTFLSLSLNTSLQSLQLTGTAKSFIALDEQLVILEARQEPESFSLISLKLGQNGGVDFQLAIQFTSEFLQ